MELAARVEQLERRVASRERLLLVGMASTAALVVCLITSRPARTDSVGTTLKAPLRIVDASGNTVLDVTTANSANRCVLTVYGTTRKPAIAIGDNGDGGTLVAYENGRPIGGISADAKQGAAFQLFQAGSPYSLVNVEATPKGGRLLLKDLKGSTTHDLH